MKRSSPILRRTPLRRVSKKRAREQRIYTQKRKAFLVRFPLCEVFGEIVIEGIPHDPTLPNLNAALLKEIFGPNYLRYPPRPIEVHHKNGRTGANYLDESTWMAVSAEAHRWLHANPKEARARGWITT